MIKKKVKKNSKKVKKNSKKISFNNIPKPKNASVFIIKDMSKSHYYSGNTFEYTSFYWFLRKIASLGAGTDPDRLKDILYMFGTFNGFGGKQYKVYWI